MDEAVLFGTASYLRVWRYDIRRTKKIQAFQPDVFGSVSIGIFCVPTHLADKEVPGPSICPFSVQTLVAPLAGVGWVHEYHRNAGALSFVGDEPAKLSKRPTVQSVALIFFSPCPFVNAVEFFEGNPTFGALSQRYDAFGNYVIGIGGEAAFFSLPFPQKSFGTFGAFLLELSAQCVLTMPHLVKLLPAVSVSIAIKRDVSHPQIYSYQVHDGLFFFIGKVNRDVKKKLALTADQVALSTRVREQLTLFFSADKRDRESLWQCPDRDKRFVQIPGEKTQVVDDCTGGVKRPLRPTDGVSASYLRAYQTGSLC
jgi:hypothetical protein